LREALSGLPLPVDPNLLVGFGGADDAGVYRLNDDTALVLTVDYFPPIVDDPFDFGRVAAANALSDVYAMGGRPLVALNICAFPEGSLPASVLGDILRGGSSVASLAGAVIAGGHTVSDKEIKYGLSVVGTVHPDRIVQNSGASVGDVLVLTKALGTGVLSTKLRAGKLDAETYAVLVGSMTFLNREASERMLEHGVHACTDVTGYGLLGHALEMAEASDVCIEISAADVPVLPGAVDAVGENFLTGGAGSNRLFVGDDVVWKRPVDETLQHLLYDPQTSGGLLIAVPDSTCDALVSVLLEACPGVAVVGRVVGYRDVRLKII
jgi:selenide,water dikinase